MFNLAYLPCWFNKYGNDTNGNNININNGHNNDNNDNTDNKNKNIDDGNVNFCNS